MPVRYLKMFLRSKAMWNVHEGLEDIGLKHWLGCGALLGIYREGDFIEWDDDVEINCRAEDYLLKAKQIKTKLKEKGFKIDEMPKRHKTNAERDGEKISIAGYKCKGKYRVRWKFCIPKKFFEEVGYIEFEGRKFPCHWPIEEYLKWFYKDWKTPYDSRIKKKSGCWNKKALTR